MAKKSEVFQFGVRKGRKIDVKRPAMEKLGKAPEETPMQPIQGKNPDSIQEWRVALALRKLHIQFEYQKSVMGGRLVAGGQVVDFWAYTQPLPTPIYVQGTYWHRRAKEYEDKLKQLWLMKQYKGQIMQPLILKEIDLESEAEAFQTLRRALIGGL